MRLPKLLNAQRARRLALLAANGLAQALTAVAMALLIAHVFNRLNDGFGHHELAWLATGLALTALVLGMLRMREISDAERLAQDYIATLRLMMFKRLSTLSSRALLKKSRGGVLLRFVGDLRALKSWISVGIARLAVGAVTLVTALGLLAIVNLELAAAAALVVIGGLAVVIGFGPRIATAVQETRRRTALIAGNVNEKIASLSVVQVFNQSRRERGRVARQSERLKHAMVARAEISGTLRGLVEISSALATLSVLVVGAMLAAEHRISPGTVVAAMTVVGFLVSPLRDFSRIYEYWHGARLSRRKIEEFLNSPSLRREQPQAPALRPTLGVIEFEDVTVQGALTGISAQIPPNARIAITGPNGAGKSTLLSLMARLLDPDQGRVLFDGQDVALHSSTSLRRLVGMVSPDLGLLRGTLGKNLRYRKPGADDAALATACRLAGVDELLAELPDGLNTRLAEGGANLSPGQRSRVALARALLGRPVLLLLDEADAYLDPKAAGALRRVLHEFDGTVVFVTHRAEHLTIADLLWYLEDGRLIEAGPATELLAGNGPAAHFFGMAAAAKQRVS